MSSDKFKYEPVEPRSREDLVCMFDSGDGACIASALYSAAYHDSDWRWVQAQCLSYLTHPDLRVRWAAATCLGDLSVFHHKLDLDLVIPALQQALSDPSIRPTVGDSLDQIQQNIKAQ